MKKTLVSFLCMLLSLSAFAIGDADFAGGTGTQTDPWQIKTAAQLNAVRDNNGTKDGVKYFKLMNDVDLNDLEVTESGNWVPISSTAAFIDFDGNGFVVKNLTIKKGDVSSPNYQSFAGVLQGSIRNLGLVNVYIDGPKIGSVGAFAGYVGGANPGANSYATGNIENCFATGYLSAGNGVVGGIAGYVGRHANDGTPSYIKNCYFSGQLYNGYNGSGASAFTGGIVGGVLVHATEAVTTTPPVQNCYATGFFETEKQKVGGIAGYTEAPIVDCVSYANLRVIDETFDFTGLITGYCSNGPKGIASGGTATTYGKVQNCYAYNLAVITKGTTLLPAVNFYNPEAGTFAPVDGTLKDLTYLSNPLNYYSEINFPMAGEQAVWSQVLRDKYPQLLWVSNRADSDIIDGLSNVPTSSPEIIVNGKPRIYSTGNLIMFDNINNTYKGEIFDVNGTLLKSCVVTNNGAEIIKSSSLYVIVKLVDDKGHIFTQKVVRN